MDNTFTLEDNHVVKDVESAESFQKFIYELFEKNGIINDLRAYLRGLIVNVLKSAQTGDPPACQKNFTQRLELTFQALNMLIAEYLLRLEFGYSLSVFLSEIPLANMVFNFAQSLMNNESETTNLRFKDKDVWSILNYLGVKCDSEHATNIIKMYNSEHCSPLLLCILKSLPMYHEEYPSVEPGYSSEESLSSSLKSSVTQDHDPKIPHRNSSSREKCKHYLMCNTCQNRLFRAREKYRKKKKCFAKMFQELKTVYETEVQMVKVEEERKAKTSIASHVEQLQRRQEEMEKMFKVRATELERSVQQKKQFLWGLARALRDQHRHMTLAMSDLTRETDRLNAKENSLKTQLNEAEEILKKQGEDMRLQISNELLILENHLMSMKTERENIHRERSELESLKTHSDDKNLNIDYDDIKSHYELLKNELSILKRYLEAARLEPKCVIERGTITDLCDVTSRLNIILNNGQDTDRFVEESRMKTPNQVMNDLKKKNVNYSQSNLDEIYRKRSRSSASSSAGDAESCDCTLQRLKDENEQLKLLARQQREHIDQLSAPHIPIQSDLLPSLPLWRPRTAPTTTTAPIWAYNVQPSISSGTLGLGGGEQLSMFGNALPRVILPGDKLPFIGVLTDRHTDSRRHVISQWRNLRHRISPVGLHVPRQDRKFTSKPDSAGPSVDLVKSHSNAREDRPTEPEVSEECPPEFKENLRDTPPTVRDIPPTVRDIPPTVRDIPPTERDISPIVRDIPPTVRHIPPTVRDISPTVREKSPNSVLRQAKHRLRKLEIEAEAVEKSYLDFRKRQSELRDERKPVPSENLVIGPNVIQPHLKRSKSLLRLNENVTNDNNIRSHLIGAQDTMKTDFNKYLLQYQNYDIGATHFRNKTTTANKIKPIPDFYSEIDHEEKTYNDNYLDTPLTEFRKLYRSEKCYSRYEPRPVENNYPPKSVVINENVGGLENTVDNFEVASTNNGDEKSYKNNTYETKPIENNYPPKNLVINENAGGLENTVDNFEVASTNNGHDNSYKIYETRPDDNGSPKNVMINNNVQELDKAIDYFEVFSDNSAKTGARKDNIKKVKNDKQAQLEILKQNVNEIYNMPDSSIETKLPSAEQVIEDSGNVHQKDTDDEALNRNLLTIEVESVSEVTDLKVKESPTQSLPVEVQSSIDSRKLTVPENGDIISTQMTIIVSPKNNIGTKELRIESPIKINRNLSPEQTEKLTRNDALDDIFHASPKDNTSSEQMDLELSKEALEGSISDLAKGEDYAEDSIADIDNYNSPSDYDNENNSPISLPKTSEDENFWDS